MNIFAHIFWWTQVCISAVYNLNKAMLGSGVRIHSGCHTQQVLWSPLSKSSPPCYSTPPPSMPQEWGMEWNSVLEWGWGIWWLGWFLKWCNCNGLFCFRLWHRSFESKQCVKGHTNGVLKCTGCIQENTGVFCICTLKPEIHLGPISSPIFMS